MKILFYRYGNVCEPDMMEQFGSIGLEVETIEEEITNKKITQKRILDLVNAKLNSESFVFVFSINFFPTISDICEIYKIPYVCWTVDSPVLELFSKSICNSVNRIFVFDKAQEDMLKPYTENVSLLPLATNVGRWDRVLSDISREDIKKYSADISFVGSLYTDNDPLKDAALSEYLKGFLDGLYSCQSMTAGVNLIERSLNDAVIKEICTLKPSMFEGINDPLFDLKGIIAAESVVGMDFSSRARIDYLTALGERFDLRLYTGSTSETLEKVQGLQVLGTVKTLTEMPKVFKLSKINLNMTIYPIQNGLPARVWDVLGCGGFLLTNYRENLLEYFTPGEDLDYFSDCEELVEKCEFYLKHDDIRERIALNGSAKVRKYHTYVNRLPVIIGSVIGS